MTTIKIATDFSDTPGARFRSDGPFSGEEFREDMLMPLFEDDADNREILIDLDGAEGYPSSFLEEAFGGLARMVGAKKVKDHIAFKTTEFDYLVPKIDEFISRCETITA